MSLKKLKNWLHNQLLRRWQPRHRPPYRGFSALQRVVLHYRWDEESRRFAESLQKELEASGREVLHLAYGPEKRKHLEAAESGAIAYARGEWNWLGVPKDLPKWRNDAPEVLIDFGRKLPPAADFYRHALPVALRVAVGEGGWADVHLPGNWAQHPFQQSERVVQYLKFINNPENETASRNRRGFGNAL